MNQKKRPSGAPDESAQGRRSRTMRAVRARNTSPELFVRGLLRRLGFGGYRLHRKDLPGNPDIVFIGRKKAIFVHGCFWHGHDCARGARPPATNADYWSRKIARNQERDAASRQALKAMGWSVVTVWECELRDSTKVAELLNVYLSG